MVIVAGWGYASIFAVWMSVLVLGECRGEIGQAARMSGFKSPEQTVKAQLVVVMVTYAYVADGHLPEPLEAVPSSKQTVEAVSISSSPSEAAALSALLGPCPQTCAMPTPLS